MTSCLYWDIHDTEGVNPLEKPGQFEFRVWYEIDPGNPGYTTSAFDTEPGYGPGADLTNAECLSVRIETDADTRPPTEREAAMLADWFFYWLDLHKDARKQIECRALEYSYIGDDDIDAL